MYIQYESHPLKIPSFILKLNMPLGKYWRPTAPWMYRDSNKLNRWNQNRFYSFSDITDCADSMYHFEVRTEENILHVMNNIVYLY